MEPTNREETVEIDLGELFQAIKEKIWIILAVMLVCAAIAGNITYFFIDPTYTATSTIYLLPRNDEQTTLTDLNMASTMTKDAIELAKSKSVVETVIDALHLNLTYDEMVKKISVNNPSDTRLIEISVEDGDPQMAADLSNALASSLADQVAEIMKTDRPTEAEKAVAPEKPSAPSMKKNVAIAALLGLFAAVAVVVIQHIRDDTIKSPDDVEKYLQLNTLASIPVSYEETETSKKDKKKANRKLVRSKKH